jgi:hypothetical protein
MGDVLAQGPHPAGSGYLGDTPGRPRAHTASHGDVGNDPECRKRHGVTAAALGPQRTPVLSTAPRVNACSLRAQREPCVSWATGGRSCLQWHQGDTNVCFGVGGSLLRTLSTKGSPLCAVGLRGFPCVPCAPLGSVPSTKRVPMGGRRMARA